MKFKLSNNLSLNTIQIYLFFHSQLRLLYVQQILMQNKQLRERIDEVWCSLKGLKAIEIQNQIFQTKNQVQRLIGVNEIQKTRNSSLLKLFIYELIIFANQKCKDRELPSTHKITEFSRISQRSGSILSYVKELKKSLAAISSRNKLSSNQARLDINQFKDILKKVNSIQEQLLREESSKKKIMSTTGSQDQDGMELMVEQLESIIKKKENRIKELNNQLQQNFHDKQQLQQEIQGLQERNLQLQQSIKSISSQCQKIKDQFQKYKIKQKEQLILGASDFMNNSFKNKYHQDLPKGSITTNQQYYNGDTGDMSQSTKILSKYCSIDKQKDTYKQDHEIEQKTIKKSANTMKKQQVDQHQQQNLLQSIKIFKSHLPYTQQPPLLNDDYILQRMLLTQAIFIEKAMASIMN